MQTMCVLQMSTRDILKVDEVANQDKEADRRADEACDQSNSGQDE